MLDPPSISFNPTRDGPRAPATARALNAFASLSMVRGERANRVRGARCAAIKALDAEHRWPRQRDKGGNTMSTYAGRTQEERRANRKKTEQLSQQTAGGEMAVPGTESDKTHSCGES